MNYSGFYIHSTGGHKMTVRQKGIWQGMNWIRQEKRLAIYLRDGLACAYCGDSVENGARLTLDHILPASKGGSNDDTNLITCCERCNKSRGNRSIGRWTKAVADYLNHSCLEVFAELYKLPV